MPLKFNFADEELSLFVLLRLTFANNVSLETLHDPHRGINVSDRTQ